MEEDLLAKGIALESLYWPERVKHWFFAHGGKLDPETGVPIFAGALAVLAQWLLEILDAFASGEFVHNWEKDELTHALQNPKHPS
jgi:hypothetical protein